MDLESSSLSLPVNSNTQESSNNDIFIRIINDSEIETCNFWIAFYEKGTLTPQNILDLPTTSSALYQAISLGIEEEDPLLLTDSSFDPPKFIHLTPVPLDGTDTSWIDKLVKTISSLNIKKIGIYLFSKSMNIDLFKNYLASTLSELISNTQISEYYLLTKDYGINTLINTSLGLKKFIKNKNIVLFHK